VECPRCRQPSFLPCVRTNPHEDYGCLECQDQRWLDAAILCQLRAVCGRRHEGCKTLEAHQVLTVAISWKRLEVASTALLLSTFAGDRDGRLGPNGFRGSHGGGGAARWKDSIAWSELLSTCVLCAYRNFVSGMKERATEMEKWESVLLRTRS
jgi:hypothetical protein